MSLTIKEYDTLYCNEVRAAWETILLRFPKWCNDLCASLELHQLVYEMDKSHLVSMKVQVFLDDTGTTVGIVPFACYLESNRQEPGVWKVNASNYVLSWHYLVDPNYFSQALLHFPPHIPYDLNFKYVPTDTSLCARLPANVIKLPRSYDEYLVSVGHKSRHKLRSNSKANKDLRVVRSNQLDEQVILSLLPNYLSYWDAIDAAETVTPSPQHKTSRHKINSDIEVLRYASKVGKLRALYIYHGEVIVSANFSVSRNLTGGLDDYLCLRHLGYEYKKRGLGIFSILENIKWAIESGLSYYDMSASANNRHTYKQQFLAGATYTYYTFAKLNAFDLLNPSVLSWTLPLIVDGTIVSTRQELFSLAQSTLNDVVLLQTLNKVQCIH